MIDEIGASGAGANPNRRQVLTSTTAMVAAAGLAASARAAEPPGIASRFTENAMRSNTGLQHQKIVGFMLGHEQFTVPELVDIGGRAASAGFGLLATSDHFQPWQPMRAIVAKPG